MSVITLTPQLLDSACALLAGRVVSAGFHPDVIIGIRNGGAQVAQRMLPSLPDDALYCEVCISRPSTAQKKVSFTHRLLQHLPLCVCDLLRILESRVTELRSSQARLVRVGEVSFAPDICQRLQQVSCNVLIVDDAIDSGATLLKLQEQLNERYPHLSVRVAVITVTTPHPLCDADFSLYHDRTLCRFPWSNDYRTGVL